MSNDIISPENLRRSDRHSLAMEIMFDDKLYERTTSIASRMADAVGFTPKHLIGKPAACYAVVTRSIMWGLDPFSVAMSTYDVKGKIGFEGKLCHAILERSGRFEGRIKYEMIGDWEKIQGKFTKVKSENGEYAKAAWQDKDEEGLGVKIVAQLKGENKPIEFIFWFKQAFPRNSTLWATDPVTQIKYLAIRRFANSVVPDVFMGVPFDREDFAPDIKDVSPPSDNTALKEAFLSKGDDVKEAQEVKVKTKMDEILQPDYNKNEIAEEKAEADEPEEGEKANVEVEKQEPKESSKKDKPAANPAKGKEEVAKPKDSATTTSKPTPARVLVDEIKEKIAGAKTPAELTQIYSPYENKVLMMREEYMAEVLDCLEARQIEFDTNDTATF